LFSKTGSGKPVIAPGNPEGSSLIQHIFSPDPEMKMPPPESHLSLSAEEKALLYTWVDQGAEWKKHWAFLPPEKPRLPKVRDRQWPRNAIDAFVLSRLEREGIQPSEQASPERLLRRAHLDLTGLPPSPEQVDAFLADPSPAHYARIVDQLMESDAFAERLAMEWLDVARYADSHGYHADGWRSMYPWRDWVISAFQRNMPFDQFATWQLAGDLLPQASEEQILATGFNRNHQITAEGGVIDEEYRLEYVFDRVNTAATAFMGLTLKCAQCHDHKFDPVSQKEFYEFSAFFNQVDELGMNTDDGNCGPTLLLLSDSAKLARKALGQEEARLRAGLRYTEAEVARMGAWMDKLAAKPLPAEPEGLLRHYPLESLGSTRHPYGVYATADRDPKATFEGEPSLGPGKKGKAVCFDNEYESLFIEDIGRFERHEPFSAGAWIHPERGKGLKAILCNSGDKNNLWRGWDFLIDTLGQLNFRLIHALPHDQASIRSCDTVAFERWQHVFVTYDGSGSARGMRIFLDGRPCESEILYDQLDRSILPVDAEYNLTPRALRAGKWYEGFSGEIAFLKGCFDDIRVYERQLSAPEVAQLASGLPMEAVLAQASGAEQAEYYLLRRHQAYDSLQGQLRELVRQQTALMDRAVEVQVMDEHRPRATYVLDRGVYTERREEVRPGVPVAMGGFPEGLPRNRLGLARWLFSPDNPLTARVTVNRYWQLFFGKGLVATPHDFGNQGALPSHPELLDWLAVDFREHGWDLRHLIRQIVTSATYCQDSDPRKDLEEKDPENILLARGPLFRLPAEMIRDQALAASGLLVQRVGGEPVKPYQPDNIWGEKSFFSYKYLVYRQDSGANLYRRSLYTILKRTSPHPAMIVLDGNDRSYCIVKRPTTNTPLQALVLLNDPTYVEAARVLAERVQAQGQRPGDWITQAFRRLTGRRPRTSELALLEEQFAEEKKRFEQEPERAAQLLSVGEFPRSESLDPATTAALAVVSSTLLNFDECYMRR
jgi:hypothetical protein